MIYGIGTNYGSVEEKLPEFVLHRAICVGWPPHEAPALHQLLGQIGVGDLVFAKSFPPKGGLYIKGVAIVTSSRVREYPNDLGFGREVKWVWTSLEGREPVLLGRLDDKYDNMRGGSLYQEFGPKVQTQVIEILLNPDKF